jgi:hypothetical protein
MPVDQANLPYVDEHCVAVAAGADAVWTALCTVLRRNWKGSAGFAQLLGCEPAQASPSFNARLGETLPGFRVAEAEPGRRLALRGRHRFAIYELTFILRDHRLCAQTHAAFPGVVGQLYRALVIGSRGHHVIVRQLLRRIARAA